MFFFSISISVTTVISAVFNLSLFSAESSDCKKQRRYFFCCNYVRKLSECSQQQTLVERLCMMRQLLPIKLPLYLIYFNWLNWRWARRGHYAGHAIIIVCRNCNTLMFSSFFSSWSVRISHILFIVPIRTCRLSLNRWTIERLRTLSYVKRNIIMIK